MTFSMDYFKSFMPAPHAGWLARPAVHDDRKKGTLSQNVPEKLAFASLLPKGLVLHWAPSKRAPNKNHLKSNQMEISRPTLQTLDFFATGPIAPTATSGQWLTLCESFEFGCFFTPTWTTLAFVMFFFGCPETVPTGGKGVFPAISGLAFELHDLLCKKVNTPTRF